MSKRKTPDNDDETKQEGPTKHLYTVFIVDREGFGRKFLHVVWAHSKTEVILWLKKKQPEWWGYFLECLQGEMDYTDEQMHAIPATKLVKLMEEYRSGDFHGQYYHIVETPSNQIVDITCAASVMRAP